MKLINADVVVHKLKTAIESGNTMDLEAVLSDVEAMPGLDPNKIMQMKQLIEMVNVVEIADASLFGSLGAWTETWKSEMNKCMKDLIGE